MSENYVPDPADPVFLLKLEHENAKEQVAFAHGKIRNSMYAMCEGKTLYQVYLEEQQQQDPEGVALAHKLYESLDPPTSSLTRAIVAIPVAGHQESGTIRKTLEQYKRQMVGKDLWEIVLFVNSPKHHIDGTPLSNQKTLDEISRAKEDFGLSNVRVMQHQYEKPIPMGQIRKNLWDTIVVDAAQRGLGRTLIINNDSDTVHLRSDYLTQMMYPHIVNGRDHFRAPLRFETVADAPLASSLVRLHWHMYTASSYADGGRPAVEANSAIDLALYCKAGGINPLLNTNEYNELTYRLNHIRQEYPQTNIHKALWIGNAPLKTSSRRQLAVLALGNNLHQTWQTDHTPFTQYDKFREFSASRAAEARVTDSVDEQIHATIEGFVDPALKEGRYEYCRRMLTFGEMAVAMTGLAQYRKAVVA